jgi:hypothetical protein
MWCQHSIRNLGTEGKPGLRHIEDAGNFSQVRGSAASGILRAGGRSMISMMLWPIVPVMVAAQISTAASLKCPVVAGIKAEAPPDQSADRFSGYWHMSIDRLIWAPAAAPGSVQTFLGPYWVRPAGTRLTLTVRRLDVPGPLVTLRERAEYPTGF